MFLLVASTTHRVYAGGCPNFLSGIKICKQKLHEPLHELALFFLYISLFFSYLVFLVK